MALRQSLEVFDFSPCSVCSSCEMAEANANDCIASGEWVRVPYIDSKAAERLFRHKVWRFFRREDVLSQERLELLLSWRNSGFSVHNDVRLLAGDTKALAPSEVSSLRRRWAELLMRVYEIDPLVCAKCGAEMKVIAFITQPLVIHRILDHLQKKGLTQRPPRALPEGDPGRTFPVLHELQVASVEAVLGERRNHGSVPLTRRPWAGGPSERLGRDLRVEAPAAWSASKTLCPGRVRGQPALGSGGQAAPVSCNRGIESADPAGATETTRTAH